MAAIRPRFGVLLLLWLTGLYLRVPVLVIPPLSPFIGDELSLDSTTLGALTTLPVLMLAIGAVPGALAIARLGARGALMMALVLVAIGSALRGVAESDLSLLGVSALMGLGIAVMQPALPALLPRWLSYEQVALGSAVYMNGMLMGEFISAGLTLPVVMPLVEGSWRAALWVWSLPALLLVFALKWPRDHEPDRPVRRPGWMPDWRHPLVWQMGLILGSSSTLFFGLNAHMASLLKARGALDALDQVLFWFNFMQVLASFLMLKAAHYWVGKRLPILLCVMLDCLLVLGFWWGSGAWAVVCVVALSFCSAILLVLMVSLVPSMVPADEVGRMSAGCFTIGYVVSFVMPLLGGILADTSGDAEDILWVLSGYALLTIPLAWRLRLHSSAHPAG